MSIDEDLMQYCIYKEFPVDEMNEKEFKIVEDTVGFNLYKLGILLRSLGKDILHIFKKML